MNYVYIAPPFPHQIFDLRRLVSGHNPYAIDRINSADKRTKNVMQDGLARKRKRRLKRACP